MVLGEREGGKTAGEGPGGIWLPERQTGKTGFEGKREKELQKVS